MPEETVKPVLPVVQGDWVGRDGNSGFEVARVRQAYMEDGKCYADLVPYDLSGKVLGRVSPAFGGPKSFEPWCRISDYGWHRISRPDFPLSRGAVGVPSDTPGMVTLKSTIFHSEGVKAVSWRIKPKKQSSDRPRQKARIIYMPTNETPKNLQVDIEVASLRRAAQELRTQAKFLSPTLGGEVLRNRAIALEKEADALKPVGA